MEIKKVTGAIVLVILGILFRTVFHIAPNVEFVTTAALLSATYLGGRYALLVPFAIMVLTDTLIGNTNIFIFTWSAYLIIGILGYLLKLKTQNSKLKILKATGAGIGAGVFFYLYTNFGVWLLDEWGMYSKDLNGLINCYLAGLPFFRLNLLGNLFFVPVSFGAVELYSLFFPKIKNLLRPETPWMVTLKRKQRDSPEVNHGQ